MCLFMCLYMLVHVCNVFVHVCSVFMHMCMHSYVRMCVNNMHGWEVGGTVSWPSTLS